jgi:hypothetical protein
VRQKIAIMVMKFSIVYETQGLLFSAGESATQAVLSPFYFTFKHLVSFKMTRLSSGSTRNRGSIPGRDKIFISSPKGPDRLWGPPNFLFYR